MTTTNDRAAAATQVQQWPGYVPAYPPPAPPTWQPEPPRKGGGGLALVIAALTGAVVAGTVAALVTTGIRDTTPVAPVAAPATVTVAPPAPPVPAPLPAAQADSITCEQGWNGAVPIAHVATEALKTLPPDMKTLDPAVRANPEWTAAVQKAGDSWQQAGEFVRTHIAPGTTPILASAVEAAARAASAYGYAIRSFNPATTDAGDLVTATSHAVEHLCDRLSP